jgi:dTDP-4-amino-4,6-dideoxygalactose transaminase
MPPGGTAWRSSCPSSPSGRTPRFVEVSPDTLCVEAEAVWDALGPDTRAVLPVLFGGRSVDLSGVRDLLAARDVTVIKDAAHAFGSFAGDRRVGATGALTCISFGPIKNLTCIEGGALVPRTADEARTLRQMRTLGIALSQAERQRTTTYTVGGFGLRVTLSSVHAAVGSVQLARFADVETRRKALWAYAAALEGRDDVTLVDVGVESAVPFHCVVRVPSRDTVHRLLREHGIGVGVHYPPNHLQPAFAPWHRSLPVTEQVGREILSLPFHPG